MKDSYYFPHDYHARHDPKLERLRMVMGCEGIGIYWCLVEMLYEEGGSLELKDIEIYAKSLNTTAEKISQTLTEFNLFRKNKTHFYSLALTKRLKHINIKREKARISAKLSHSANAQRTHSERPAIKESKVKESKVNNNYNPNTEFYKKIHSLLQTKILKNDLTKAKSGKLWNLIYQMKPESAIAVLERCQDKQGFEYYFQSLWRQSQDDLKDQGPGKIGIILKEMIHV